MTLETWLRLALVPAAVWLASLAGRRWGHAASGYLGGMPMIGGPIMIFLALDLGVVFAAKAALFTLVGVAGQGAHLTVMAHIGQRRGWLAALVGGWAAFAAVALAVSFLPADPWLALVVAILSLMAAWRWMPQLRGETPAPSIPPMELRLRLLASFALAGFILWSAPVFGPTASGLLLSVPITGSIMPPFTLALYGPAALTRITRGYVVGLSGFLAFFFALALLLVRWGLWPAFVVGVSCAVATVFGVRRLVDRRA